MSVRIQKDKYRVVQCLLASLVLEALRLCPKEQIDVHRHHLHHTTKYSIFNTHSTINIPLLDNSYDNIQKSLIMTH